MCIGSRPWGEGFVGKACRVLGCLQVRHPQWLTRGLSVESLMWLVGSVFLWWILFWARAAILLVAHHSPSCNWQFSILSGKGKQKSLCHVWPFGTPWTIQTLNSLGQNTGVGSLSLLQGIFPTQGLNPGHPHSLRADSLPAEPQGRPKNTGVGSLSLLQQIFSTQESNWGLLHCRQILYQLSYLGSLFWVGWEANVLLWQWPAQLWKQGVYLHTLTLPMGGITGWFLVTVLVQWCVLSLSCAILGEGVNTGKVKLSLSSSPVCKILDFVFLFVCLFLLLLQQCAGTSLLESQASAMPFLSIGDCQHWYSLRGRR